MSAFKLIGQTCSPTCNQFLNFEKFCELSECHLVPIELKAFWKSHNNSKWMLCKLCADSKWIIQPPFSQLLSIFKTNERKIHPRQNQLKIKKKLTAWTKSLPTKILKKRLLPLKPEAVCKSSFRRGLIQFPFLQSGEDTVWTNTHFYPCKSSTLFKKGLPYVYSLHA